MRVVIVGVSTRAIAQSARRAGYAFWTVDYFGDYDQKLCCQNLSLHRDLGQPLNAWRLYRASTLAQADAVVYLANLENHPDVVAALAEQRRLLGNRADTVAAVRDWGRLAAFLARLGVRTPRTFPAENAGPEGTWLVKPQRSGGGHGIRFWNGESLDSSQMLQEYVEGLPCSVSFVADGRRGVILGVCQQLIGLREFGAKGFRYCGNIYPLCPPPSVDLGALAADLQRTVNALVAEYGLLGVGGVDFLLSGGEVVVLEVNPRYTASMELMERSRGFSVFDVHMRAFEGELPPSNDRAASGYWGKAIVYAHREVVTRDAHRWLERGICDIPFDGDRVRAGHPVCTVLARGTSQDECLERLTACAREVRRDLDHGYPL